MMLRRQIRFQRPRVVRPISNAEEQPRLRTAALVRDVQQLCREHLSSDNRAIYIWNPPQARQHPPTPRGSRHVQPKFPPDSCRLPPKRANVSGELEALRLKTRKLP